MYEERTPSGGKVCSFKEFYEHPFLMFKGNLNFERSKGVAYELEGAATSYGLH
jgi:hypothetical protein